MSDLSESLKKLKFDNRMVKWNISQKLLTAEEYKKYVANLEDVSHLQNTEEPVFDPVEGEETDTVVDVEESTS